MSSTAARDAAAAAVHHALPGSRYAVALLEPQSGTQMHAGWVGTLRLTVRSGVQSTSTLPGAGGASSRVSVPLPGGVLGADGPQVVAVTADTTMRAASADNVAPLGERHRPCGRRPLADRPVRARRWAGGRCRRRGSNDSSGPYHAVEPVLLPDLNAWPWVLAGAALVVLAAVLLLRGARRRGRRQ